MQKVAEEALAGKRGAVVAIDPKTGDIIALASTPGFDPNDFVKGLTVSQYSALANNIDVPLLNRALRGAYPPGSTVKPLYALAAQHYGILTPEQTQYCSGSSSCRAIRGNYHDDKKGGTEISTCVRPSPNPATCTSSRWPNGSGIERMSSFMNAFGYGVLTGIDIPGEKPGLYGFTGVEEARLQAQGRPGVVSR